MDERPRIAGSRDGEQWYSEIKFDDYRVIAVLDGGRIPVGSLQFSNGIGRDLGQ